MIAAVAGSEASPKKIVSASVVIEVFRLLRKFKVLLNVLISSLFLVQMGSFSGYFPDLIILHKVEL
jgi:hypothetical protein